MIGDFEVRYTDLAGRVGYLETKHGKLELPAFFPVIDPVKSDIKPTDLESVGFNNFITNSLFLKKYTKTTDVHDFFHFDGIIMTDSGAYQILEYGNVDVTNEEIVRYELTIKPDIAVFLDFPTGDLRDYEKARETVEETLRRGEEVTRIIKDDDEVIWVHPIQGGIFYDLVSLSASIANSRKEFKMLALGSPTVLMEDYDYESLFKAVVVARSNTSRGKPFHLFGAGLPHLIPFVVALGVDAFDSASYILYARDNRYMTRERVLRLEKVSHFPCSCPICVKYTPRELLQLDKEQRWRELAIHNLYKIKEELAEVKQVIKEGRLFEYLEMKAVSHPKLASGFRLLVKEFKEYLETYHRRTSRVGIFLFGEESLNRPEVIRHRRFMESYNPPKGEKVVLICGSKMSRPFIKSRVIKEVEKKVGGAAEIYVYFPFFGVIPLNLSEVFPLSQFEAPKLIPKGVSERLKEDVLRFCEKLKGREVYLVPCEEDTIECGNAEVLRIQAESMRNI